MSGTVRTFDPTTRDLIEERLKTLAETIAAAHGAQAAVTYRRMFPPVVNHARETAFAVETARTIVDAGHVSADLGPLMASEDFAFMLERRPGNITLIGDGDTAGVRDARYDFDDAAIPYGVARFVALIERGLPLGTADVPSAAAPT